MTANPYEAEARERWGHTAAYKESRAKTSSYSAEDWNRVQSETNSTTLKFVEAMKAGLSPDSDEAMAAAERHRLQICEFYYACDYTMHTMLADMYVADERFTAHYEQFAPGLAHYISAAIHANAIARS